MQDQYGNEVTTSSASTVEAVDRFSNSLIGFGTDFGVIFEASDADPDCGLAAALAGLLGLYMETPNRREVADTYFKRASAAASVATEREQWMIQALQAARKGDLRSALLKHHQIAKNYPRDLLSAKVGQGHYFNLGDDEGMLWLADQVIDAHQDTAYAHGMRAFGLEQMSRLQEAEEEGRRATEMQRCEPWAHHAVAHVMITQGRHDEGVRWMQELSAEWDGCNSFMYTHNWWHLALFLLEQEQFRQALTLYDTHIWGRDKSYSQDQINAISLLWRLELAGADVGDRWEDLSEHVANRSFVNDQPFLDMQYAFALAKGGKLEALGHLTNGMDRMARSGPEMTRDTWEHVALPAAQAFIAFADEDYARAQEYLSPVRTNMQSVGGSHAQRDLFEQVWIHSLLRQGKNADALPLLQARLDFRKPAQLDIRWFDAAKTGLA
jgi:hypothetical protein